MNVLQLSRWLVDSGGGGIQTYLECVGKSLQGHDVELFYAALLSGSVPGYTNGRVRLGIIGKSKVRNAFLLWKWFDREVSRFDLVHIHGITDWHFIVGVLACLRHKKPYVVSVHGALFPGALAQIRRWPRITVPSLKLVGRLLLERSECVVTATESEKEVMCHIAPNIKSTLVRPGVEVSALSPFCSTEGDGDHHLRVIFIGQIGPVKSLTTLLDALARLRNEGFSVKLDIVGSGDSRYIAGLQKRVLDLKIGDCVIFHGYKRGEGKQSLLTEADLLVLPSFSENFGFVAAEAMAFGMPVVVSDGVGVAAQVLRYRAGSVFPVGDDEALANALRSFLDPEEVKICGERAYDCAKNEFSLENMGREILKVYRQALESCPKVKG